MQDSKQKPSNSCPGKWPDLLKWPTSRAHRVENRGFPGKNGGL